MFDNVNMTKEQREALENNIDNLSLNGIHGIVIINDEFIDTENEDGSCTLVDGEIIFTLLVSEDKYIKTMTITDREQVLFSLAPMSVVIDFPNKGIRDDL